MGKHSFEEKLLRELRALQSAIHIIEERQTTDTDRHRVQESGTLALLHRRRQAVEHRLERLRLEGDSLWVNLRDEMESEWDELMRALAGVAGDPVASVSHR